jgi:endogenous inhibitor of DNA gyrase (YacG/DUF329 family)
MAAKKVKTAKAGCPICGKPAAEAHIPFCSQRCADIDLNRWLGGNYRIPTDERPDAASPGPEEEE